MRPPARRSSGSAIWKKRSRRRNKSAAHNIDVSVKIKTAPCGRGSGGHFQEQRCFCDSGTATRLIAVDLLLYPSRSDPSRDHRERLNPPCKNKALTRIALSINNRPRRPTGFAIILEPLRELRI